MKPYSPLPWGSLIQCGDAIIKNANGESTFCDTSYYPWVECRDFDYIVHAANAYPKLVEALKNAPQTSSANDLLRELGEL